MNIARCNIRSVVLQALLLIFLAILRTKADENEQDSTPLPFHIVKLDYFHNVPNFDPVLLPTVQSSDHGGAETTTTTITTTTITPLVAATTTTADTVVQTTAETTQDTTKFVKPPFYKTKETTTTITNAKETTTTEPNTQSTSDSTTTTTQTIRPAAATFISDSTTDSTADPTTTTTTTTTDSTATEQQQTTDSTTSLDFTTSSFIEATMTLPLSILTSTASASASSSHPSIPLNTTTSNTTIQYTNTSDPLVQYDLECRADDVFCEKVSRAVGAAIDEFTRVINVKNSLLIKVTYYSFCEKTCANDTLGWGTPTSQFTLPFEDGADLNYVYPQALAKQLAPYSSTSVWTKYDIEIEINHDVYLNETDVEQAIKDGWNGNGTIPNGKYWFFNDSGTNNISTSTSHAIQSHQVDFRYVVLHELLHGLGFLSSWAAYFWTDASPFRTLVEGVIDPLELQLVTPGPYWFINQDTGPAYVTGFQPTMIFDKYLVNVDTELNVTSTSSLSDLAFEMQDFCVQNNNAFIVNFIRSFNAANQSTTAHKLWISMSQPETVSFQFQPPTVPNSSYNLIPYLNQTYQSITLLTGADLFTRSSYEQTDATLNRPGLMISHLDDQYSTTPDFLMTQKYHQGQTLEDLVKQFYDTIPAIKYNTTTPNNTMIEATYLSPIGPGVLRILDSIGYSTVLTRTNYTTDGNVKAPKSRSICEDSNTNHGLKPSPSATSIGNILSYDNGIIFITFLISLFFYIVNNF